MRPMLQFVGFASSAVWALLMVGTILTATANADVRPAPLTLSCQDCYGCVEKGVVNCYYSGIGRGCSDVLTCNCNFNNGTLVCTQV